MPVVELNRGERQNVARTPRREERSFDILTAKVVGINKPLEIGQRNSTVGKKTLVPCSNIWPWLRAGRLRVWVPVQVQTGGGGDAWEWRARVATAGRGPWATGHRHQPSSYIHTWGTKGANENRSAVQGVGKMGRLSWLGRIGRGREAGGGGGGGGSGDGVGNGNGNRHGYGHGYWVGYGGRSVERVGRV